MDVPARLPSRLVVPVYPPARPHYGMDVRMDISRLLPRAGDVQIRRRHVHPMTGMGWIHWSPS